MGRNTRQLLELIDRLESQGIYFRSLTEGIATTGPMGKAILTVMSAFAQLERDQLAERTKAGLAAAAARGRKGGRPAVTPETEGFARLVSTDMRDSRRRRSPSCLESAGPLYTATWPWQPMRPAGKSTWWTPLPLVLPPGTGTAGKSEARAHQYRTIEAKQPPALPISHLGRVSLIGGGARGRLVG